MELKNKVPVAVKRVVISAALILLLVTVLTNLSDDYVELADRVARRVTEGK